MKIKKIVPLVLTAVLAAAVLTGCGDLSDDPNSSQASVGYPDEDGYAEGGIGDTMHTYFFDYTVNSAYTCASYENYKPAEGLQLVVAEITVKNTFTESIEMYDQDFQIQWSDNSDDAFGWPITMQLASGETIGQNMLPDVYELGIRESRTGILVYEVPTGEKDFSISYMTYFDDDTEGDVFFVYFTAKPQ